MRAMEQDRSIEATKLALSHYWQQIRKDWKLTFPTILLPGLSATLVRYVPPLIVANALVKLSSSQPKFGDFLPYLVLLVVLWIIGEAIWRLVIHLGIIAQVRGMRRLYNGALGFLMEKDLGFFHDNFAGSLTKKALGYGRRYEEFIDALTFDISPSLLPLIFVSVVLWHYSPWLVFTLLGLFSVAVLLIVPLIRRRRKLVTKREEASNLAAGYIADVISNADTVKAFGREAYELKSYDQRVKDHMGKTRKSWDYQNLRIDMTAAPMYILINAVGLSVAFLVQQRTGAKLQVVFVTFAYYTQFTQVIWNFSNIYRRLETTITDAAQFTELLLEMPKTTDPAKPSEFKVTKGEIELKDVKFRYEDNSGQHLFEDFNLKVPSGQKIALVGRSGGGKTTITRLLLRFMDIDSGQILIDGRNISEVTQSELRRFIGYVPQEPAMFHRTLTDNIRYGKLDADEKDVKRAAKAAHAAEFIDVLPEGYSTLVGERGIKLSGGQRQRIAIARAILKDAPILVLDEATSSLDSESELLIQDALWKLMEGRTAIVIAHRLSTIQRMDKIIVLDQGTIVEQGTHKELLELDGLYAKLWAHQSGGFLED